jgi:hypothetical protein
MPTPRPDIHLLPVLSSKRVVLARFEGSTAMIELTDPLAAKHASQENRRRRLKAKKKREPKPPPIGFNCN